jgi:hypothetical protein
MSHQIKKINTKKYILLCGHKNYIDLKKSSKLSRSLHLCFYYKDKLNNSDQTQKLHKNKYNNLWVDDFSSAKL